ncbi:DUF3054 domain-containing protein [Actinomyces qiguomingii]|uniref:DUF3054 domain-containing protein n=1 Tax=Actinomyces qiguomingii TaxID=2057800 RepID=UPI000CA08532|nr:DUF3054 domain-containing protein [Actinomyces qiguomingii]
MQEQQRDEPGRISYTPPVPDGPDRPWTRGRRTRWWLVLLADTVSVALVACFAAASSHDLIQVPGLAVRGAVAVVIAWTVAWLVRRPGDHLEVGWPDGASVIVVTWALWSGLYLWRAPAGASTGTGAFAVMLAAFLVVFCGGWRSLYGYVKAHDSLVPKGVQRRLDAQSRRDRSI